MGLGDSAERLVSTYSGAIDGLRGLLLDRPAAIGALYLVRRGRRDAATVMPRPAARTSTPRSFSGRPGRQPERPLRSAQAPPLPNAFRKTAFGEPTPVTSSQPGPVVRLES